MEFCKSCYACQIAAKAKSGIPRAPLCPVPAISEPFSTVLIDCVGPLPKTRSGNQYMLTIMCLNTRFPEAIPLRDIKTRPIIKALIKFFTLFDLPRILQSDQGSNFMSGVFQQVMLELGITQNRSSAYHPQSQGAIERFHQTLKAMIRIYCHENVKNWDEGIPLLMFAAREAVQESTGFSPFDLVFGHTVRGPLQHLKEKFLVAKDANKVNLLQYVLDFRSRLATVCKLACENLQASQKNMKIKYDKKTTKRKFGVGDKVLVLFPVSGKPLEATYSGPYRVKRKLSDLNYEVTTPD